MSNAPDYSMLLDAEAVLTEVFGNAFTARTLRRMVAAGKFPPHDISVSAKLRFWKRSTLAAWIEA